MLEVSDSRIALESLKRENAGTMLVVGICRIEGWSRFSHQYTVGQEDWRGQAAVHMPHPAQVSNQQA